MSVEDRRSGRGSRPSAPQTEAQRSGRMSSASRGDYSRTTREVCVSVRSFYLADQSQPDENHYVWAYRVKIEKESAAQ